MEVVTSRISFLFDAFDHMLLGLRKPMGFSGPSFGRYGLATTALVGCSLGFIAAFSLQMLFFDMFKYVFRFLGWEFWFFMLAQCFFHMSEFFLTAKFNAKTLSADSFLINHSNEYSLALFIAFSEYFVSCIFYPAIRQSKLIKTIQGISVIVVIAGEILRKLAMYTAAHNFTHIVQTTKRDNHTLVSNGVFSFLRHPSYTGWFYWTISLQLVLFNPISFVGFTIASIGFFKNRIEDEEENLCKFFPDEYPVYRKRTHVFIPFAT